MNIRHSSRISFIFSFAGTITLLGVMSADAEASPVDLSLNESAQSIELASELPVPAIDANLETSIDLNSSVESTMTPTPGTVRTTAASLQRDTLIGQSSPPPADTTPTTPAPTTPVISPGRATRSGPSYVAVGGNIGFGGSSALGEGNFVITSKIGLTNRFSARPGLVVGSRPTILLPVTVDFPIQSAITDRVRFAPFVGGGLAISTGDGSAVRALAMGGIDIPISDRFTATASANAAFFSKPEIGVILGVGYNF